MFATFADRFCKAQAIARSEKRAFTLSPTHLCRAKK